MRKSIAVRISLSLVLVCSAPTFLIAGEVESVDAKSAVLLATIEDAHAKNMAELQSIEFKIAFNNSYAPLTALLHSENGMQRYSRMSETQREELSEREEIPAKQSSRLIFSDENIRFESSGKMPASDHGELIAFRSVATSNSRVSKSLAYDVDKRWGADQGTVYTGTTNEAAMEVAVLPAMVFYYGPGQLCSGESNFQALDVVNHNDETGAIQLRRVIKKGTSGWTETYTFAERCGHNLSSILRVRESGELMSNLKIQYAREEGAQTWIPAAWQYVSFFPNGKIRYSIDAKVEQTVVNPPIENSTFDLQFGEGTVVSDHRR